MVVVRKTQAVWKSCDAGTEKKKVVRVTVKMKAAADKALRKNSVAIVESLVKKSIAGNNRSTALLVDLAKGHEDCEDKALVPPRSSKAEELAAEPEWDGGLDGADAESGSSQREPEI